MSLEIVNQSSPGVQESNLITNHYSTHLNDVELSHGNYYIFKMAANAFMPLLYPHLFDRSFNKIGKPLDVGTSNT